MTLHLEVYVELLNSHSELEPVPGFEPSSVMMVCSAATIHYYTKYTIYVHNNHVTTDPSIHKKIMVAMPEVLVAATPGKSFSSLNASRPRKSLQ